MDPLDVELYLHKRLPKVDLSDGPTAHYMRALEELASRVVPLLTQPQEASVDFVVDTDVPRRERTRSSGSSKRSRLAS